MIDKGIGCYKSLNRLQAVAIAGYYKEAPGMSSDVRSRCFFAAC